MATTKPTIMWTERIVANYLAWANPHDNICVNGKLYLRFDRENRDYTNGVCGVRIRIGGL